MLSPDPRIRKLLEDIDRSKCRVWALTNAYRTVSPTCIMGISDVCRPDGIFDSMQNVYCVSWSYMIKLKASYFAITRRKAEISAVSPSLHSTIRSAPFIIRTYTGLMIQRGSGYGPGRGAGSHQMSLRR